MFCTLDPRLEPMLGPALGSVPPQQLADTMHAAWVAFATSGQPGWLAYDIDRRATMCFDTASKVVERLRRMREEVPLITDFRQDRRGRSALSPDLAG